MRNNKPKIFKSFFIYDNEENRELLKILAEIRKRDGWTWSKLNHEALKEWAKHHYTNPQMTLAKSIGKQKVKKHCQHPNCSRLASYEVWAENGWHGFLCEQCHTQDQEARLLKGSKRL